MVKSKLSDEEAIIVTEYAVAQDISGLVKYLNNLLYKRGLGTDLCARPIALRKKDDMAQPCFAKGYLEKVLEFINETKARTPWEETVKGTKKYIANLISEINRFYK